MAKPTVSTESVAQDQLRAFVERIMRMREEAKAINDDIREIYAEAKGDGFDKTVLGKLVLYVEKRGKDSAAVAEKDALFDLYLEAFDGRSSRAHARESDLVTTRIQNNSGALEPKTSISSTAPDPHPNTARETVASTTAADPAGEADDASSADTLQEGSEPIEAHNLDRAGSTPAPATTSTEQPTRPLVDEAGQHDGGIDRGSVDTNSKEERNGRPDYVTREGESGAKPVMASEPAGEAIGTAPASPVPGRQPGCLNPDTCAGTWRKRCASCERAFMAVAAGGQAIVHQGQIA